jgi:predicted DNA-binding protein with PD1-like motif
MLILCLLVQANAEIGTTKASTAADCCRACATTAKCEIWALHTHGADPGRDGSSCHLHTAAATANPNVPGCFSGLMNKTALYETINANVAAMVADKPFF